MTLSGVLKDILLVVASMLIFRDPVSGIQAFGYSIALCGLIYYRLGLETMKEYIGAGSRAWADYGNRRPAARKLLIFVMTFVIVIVLMGAVSRAGVVPENYDPAKLAGSKLKDVLGNFGW